MIGRNGGLANRPVQPLLHLCAFNFKSLPRPLNSSAALLLHASAAGGRRGERRDRATPAESIRPPIQIHFAKLENRRQPTYRETP